MLEMDGSNGAARGGDKESGGGNHQSGKSQEGNPRVSLSVSPPTEQHSTSLDLSLRLGRSVRRRSIGMLI